MDVLSTRSCSAEYPSEYLCSSKATDEEVEIEGSSTMLVPKSADSVERGQRWARGSDAACMSPGEAQSCSWASA